MSPNTTFALNPTEDLVHPPRRPILPAGAAVRSYDAELADLLDQHPRALQQYQHAIDAIHDAAGPRGRSWKAAVQADRRKVLSGQRIESSATLALLNGANKRIAQAVIASAEADRILDRIIVRAREPKLRSAVEIAAINWTGDATQRLRDAVTAKSRARCEQIREDYALIWSPLQCLRTWLYKPTENYINQRYAWPAAIVELLDSKNVRAVLNDLYDSRDAAFGADASHLVRYRIERADSLAMAAAQHDGHGRIRAALGRQKGR